MLQAEVALHLSKRISAGESAAHKKYCSAPQRANPREGRAPTKHAVPPKRTPAAVIAQSQEHRRKAGPSGRQAADSTIPCPGEPKAEALCSVFAR
ncbi:hypothetical protein QNH46_18155 [Paenibacillus woosongensis]|uniref:Uncharacterized protein n=1 Tax=Paenibacillus woosongensis TaxID=307580 RepID=A0AA95I1U9_9BACL|nr:hypothetical protein [Paenibacillus woosongensis]WHX48036.1 hypothetical protein QNH46_18155 [Paenibacillus woosongensis]